MIFFNDLENIIFERHRFFEAEADEMIVLSGYIGPDPIIRLRELPFPTSVFYGMYSVSGIKRVVHNSLVDIQNNSQNISIYYSKMPVHSKCYIWKLHGSIIHALIGSANFSRNGLTTPFKEILAETTRDSFYSLDDYYIRIRENSTSCLELPQVLELPSFVNLGTTCSISFLDRQGNLPTTSGLNWGMNPSNHTFRDDAYIPLRTSIIRSYPKIFPPKQQFRLNDDTRGRINRNNDPIELIWDDNTRMNGLLEGSQPIDGVIYPKQISSFPQKRNLGEYIRSRLNVPLGHLITKQHLIDYGRTDITLSLAFEGVYSIDFSV